MNSFEYRLFQNKLEEPIDLGFKKDWKKPLEAIDQEFVNFPELFCGESLEKGTLPLFNPKKHFDNFEGFVYVGTFPPSFLGEHTPFDFAYIKEGQIRYLQREKICKRNEMDTIRVDSVFLKNGFDLNRIYYYNKDLKKYELNQIYRLGQWFAGDKKFIYQEFNDEQLSVFIQGKNDSSINLIFDKNTNPDYELFADILKFNNNLFKDKVNLLKAIGHVEVKSFRTSLYDDVKEKVTLEEALKRMP
ncbi:MAG: hypothetical protein P8X70_03510 [Nanoarchaeota archaeon]